MTHTERPLMTDPTFWGLLVTQFLGAFNDNVFKLIVLFLCTDRAKLNRQDDWQGYAMIFFGLPFILFSGICGFWADRYSKTRIIILSKVIEIAIMSLGLLVFWLTEPSKFQLSLLMGVLFLMGSHSAFFGPSKYGILPELYAKHRLPGINGVFLMTTFVAIIGGAAAAGALKDALPNLMSVQWICILIAIAGTLTALPIRLLPPAQPHLRFNPSAVFLDPETRITLRQQPKLLTALIYSSVFWFVGGVFQPSVNAMGKLQYGLSDTATGQLAATTAIGIAIGSVLAGMFSRSRFRAGLVRVAAVGLMLCMAVLGLPGQALDPAPVTAASSTSVTAATDAATVSEFHELSRPLVSLTGAGLLLTGAGLFAGLFAIPLQVYLQAMSPAHLKGRMIGAMNLFNWIGIVISGAFYAICNQVFIRVGASPNAIFGAIAIVILIAAIRFPMQDESLDATPLAEG